MKHINFEESNKTLQKPKGMTDEECSPLHVHTTGVECISCWHEKSLKERLKFLFTGNVWLWVWSGQTQPPVCLDLKSPFTGSKEQTFKIDNGKWGDVTLRSFKTGWKLYSDNFERVHKYTVLQLLRKFSRVSMKFEVDNLILTIGKQNKINFVVE